MTEECLIFSSGGLFVLVHSFIRLELALNVGLFIEKCSLQKTLNTVRVS